MSRVFVFGSLNMDLVIHSPREVLQGETLSGSGFMTNPGGKGANQAVACGKLGAACVMGGCVGGDAFGTELLSSLSSCGVEVSRVQRVAGAPTGVAVIVIVDHDNRIILDAGANGLASESNVDALLADACPGDILLCQLENRIEVVGYALKTARARGMMTILNPAPYSDAVREFLPYVDVITPNEGEFMSLCGTSDLKSGADLMGVPHVVVTLGSRGYAYICDGTVTYGDAVRREVVDTTAAGDTFCGALAARLSQGEPMEAALRFANNAASLTVTRPGAQQAIPWVWEVE